MSAFEHLYICIANQMPHDLHARFRSYTVLHFVAKSNTASLAYISLRIAQSFNQALLCDERWQWMDVEICKHPCGLGAYSAAGAGESLDVCVHTRTHGDCSGSLLVLSNQLDH